MLRWPCRRTRHIYIEDREGVEWILGWIERRPPVHKRDHDLGESCADHKSVFVPFSSMG